MTAPCLPGIYLGVATPTMTILLVTEYWIWILPLEYYVPNPYKYCHMTVPLLSLASSVSAKTHCDIFVGHRVLNWTRMRIWPSLVLLDFYWVWQEPVCHFLLCYVLSWNSLHGSWSSMEGEPGTSCDPPIICSQSIYERPYDLPLFSLVSAGLGQDLARHLHWFQVLSWITGRGKRSMNAPGGAVN